MIIDIAGVSFKYESLDVLKDVTFNAKKGEFLGIMGPNGSGKTTMLKCISNTLTPNCGVILIDKTDVKSFSRKDAAKQMAVVPQATDIDFSFTIEEIVLMGRTPYLGGFRSESGKDRKIAQEAMDATNVSHLSKRTFDQLSGGEKQRAIIARAICQEPKILLLDEPTTHLDIGCQLEILDLVKKLNIEKNIVVIGVFHDLNLAARYCDNLLLLDCGKVVSRGTPEQVLTPKNIKQTYNVDVLVEKHPLTNTPYVTPYFSKTQKRFKNEQTVHIVCGGGSGTRLMKLLTNHSYNISAGVLNVLDSDFLTAKELNITVIGEIPFSEISKKSNEANLELIKKADIVVLTDFPVGFGNLKNIESVEAAQAMSIPIVVVDSTPIEKKDFAGGALETSLARLEENGAMFAKNVEEAFEKIEELHDK